MLLQCAIIRRGGRRQPAPAGYGDDGASRAGRPAGSREPGPQAASPAPVTVRRSPSSRPPNRPPAGGSDVAPPHAGRSRLGRLAPVNGLQSARRWTRGVPSRRGGHPGSGRAPARRLAALAGPGEASPRRPTAAPGAVDAGGGIREHRRGQPGTKVVPRSNPFALWRRGCLASAARPMRQARRSGRRSRRRAKTGLPGSAAAQAGPAPETFFGEVPGQEVRGDKEGKAWTTAQP